MIQKVLDLFNFHNGSDDELDICTLIQVLKITLYEHNHQMYQI